MAEYVSIVLICILNTILFFGGYLYFDLSPLFNLIDDSFYYFFYYYIYDFRELNPIAIELANLALDLPDCPKPGFFSKFKVYLGIEETFDPSIEMCYALSFGLKTCILICVFIWVRASYPRIRYDQLMSFCWTILLPIIITLMILVPCILYSFDIIPVNVSL